ncbi:hypothetical protein, partial [Flavobacterium sp.]|uniref:hypothetical protein n=1 Tax=Flavobacterium sp. TaxID=239 RepID=UPI003C4599F8
MKTSPVCVSRKLDLLTTDFNLTRFSNNSKFFPMRHFAMLLGLFLTLVLVGLDAQAQATNPSQMSNSQLLRYYQQAKASGMTDMEIEQAAMARGFTVDDIAKLRQRVEGAQNQGGNRVGGRDTLGITRDRIQARPTQSPNQNQGQNRYRNDNLNS